MALVTPPESLRTKLIAHGPWALALDGAEPVEEELAQAWTEAGLAAHGAAAAQAEFAVCSLRLGVPAALLRGAARAMLDEAALSVACLELARSCGGPEVSLSRVPRRAGSAEVDRNELVLITLRRGCIAAAVEASCAREALEHCQEPAAREVLLQLEQVRASAARLGWRFLSWALRDGARELADQVRVAVLTALGTQAPFDPWSSRDRLLLRRGVLGPTQRAAIEQRVLRDVVLPCMEHTLARAVAGRAA
jgi:hypothetical protein